jgi:hypothetical protein
VTYDVGAIKKGHQKFLIEIRREEARSLAQAGEYADTHVRTKSKFKRRSSGDSVKDKTEWRIVKTSSGSTLAISNSKKVNGFDVSRGLESGTRAHVIRARPGRTLRFISHGRVFFRKSVFHPGTKPYRFLENATTAAYRRLGKLLDERFTRAARKF